MTKILETDISFVDFKPKHQRLAAMKSNLTGEYYFSAKVGGNQVEKDRVIVIDYYKLDSTGQDQDQFDRQGLFGLNLIRKR